MATKTVAPRKATKKSNKPTKATAKAKASATAAELAPAKPAKVVATKTAKPKAVKGKAIKPEFVAPPKTVATKSTKAKPAPAKSAATKTTAAKPTAVKAATKKIKSETIKSWYDYPELYEMGFLKETPKESIFLGDVFKKYVPFPVKKVLELGCGSGRLICDMSTRGYDMTGLDLNPTALDYCKKKLKKLGTKGELVVGDMTNFKFDEPFDAAVNAINTFRHLESEEAALAHLNCVADHLKVGGVFVLSLHLLPPDGDLWGTERWSAKQDDLSVYYA